MTCKQLGRSKVLLRRTRKYTRQMRLTPAPSWPLSFINLCGNILKIVILTGFFFVKKKPSNFFLKKPTRIFG